MSARRSLGARLPSGPAKPIWRAQFEANRSAKPHFEAFASHRERSTQWVRARAPTTGKGSLCVLGAGNAHDLDLGTLLESFAEVHLVDLDKSAIVGARARLPVARRSQIHLHAPIDLSGLWGRLHEWVDARLGPQDLVRWPSVAVDALIKSIGGPFDVVVSTGLMSQMQLGLVEALGPTHPLFQAARWTVNVTHLRTLARLTAPQGSALLLNDVASSADFDPHRWNDKLGELLEELESSGRLFDALRPEGLRALVCDDPALRRQGVQLGPVLDTWLWHNGPSQTFLVCAMELR